jgi:hypothetical protein
MLRTVNPAIIERMIVVIRDAHERCFITYINVRIDAMPIMMYAMIRPFIGMYRRPALLRRRTLRRSAQLLLMLAHHDRRTPEHEGNGQYADIDENC